MKTQLKEKGVEMFRMLFAVIVISTSSIIVLSPLIIEPKQKNYSIILHIFAGILIGFLSWFCWSYTSYAHKKKDWSIKNFYKHKLDETKKVIINLFKSLFWICLMAVAFIVVIIAIIFLGWIITSLSATTIIIILLILMLFKK